MSCDCHMEAECADQRRVLVRLLAVNATLFVVELVVGLLADSSGVLADSLDMLADALVYGVGLYAVGKAAAIKQRSAWWSGVFQLLLAVSILADAIRRAVYGSEPESALMMAMSFVALMGNAYCLVQLQQHRDGEVHMRASWIFSRSDVIANLGVILAGGLVWLLHSRWPDLIVGATIACVVIVGGVEILRVAERTRHQDRDTEITESGGGRGGRSV